MSQRTPDMTLASTFTRTSHAHPTPTTNSPPGLIILIIGASHSISAVIVKAYVLAGASTLILAARPSSATELSSVSQRILSSCTKSSTPAPTIHLEQVDISSSSSVSSLAQRISSKLPNLDIVILNSGLTGPLVLHVDKGDPQDFSNVLDAIVKGTYHVAQYFIPLLKANEGGKKMFIAVGLIAACITEGPFASTAYCLAKLAQARLVEFLAEQYKGEGVLAVAVHPGAVNTKMASVATPESLRAFLSDDVELCGAFCVWLSREKRM
ncbi:hypothetical protein COCSADRAFT_188322 [Bipolaris sorokiniana ND90Pr]|uniref:NAD(P)-binding protein n=1 Tax=Cochliobolus sativus (strain ND90Pr / ATCC 201652) TaxID=665912 RepID=M2SKE3_COCSN|nr:uncharacterized protein COCSADRAFT_188322 [Bipolaris sorokiniana ND90Pr]EMD67638.1 hypothetical protein COCSADRAFT_188322 [Bipolaris sorokiniana ND90Pr]